MTSWTVLLSDPAGVDGGLLASFFAAEQKIPLIDAQRGARHAWGFLGRDLDEAKARALVKSAENVGIKARVVETKNIPVLSDPSSFHGVHFEPDSLTFSIGHPSKILAHPLSNIQLLSVAMLRQDRFVTKTTREEVTTGRRIAGLGIMLATGIPVGMGKAKETQKTVAETEWVLFLDIFGRGVRWRAVPAGFDFSGLGPEKGSVGPDNLRRLLARIHRLAPTALLNRGARWWLESRPLNGAGYDEMSDVDQEARWLLTMAGCP